LVSVKSEKVRTPESLQDESPQIAIADKKAHATVKKVVKKAVKDTMKEALKEVVEQSAAETPT